MLAVRNPVAATLDLMLNLAWECQRVSWYVHRKRGWFCANLSKGVGALYIALGSPCTMWFSLSFRIEVTFVICGIVWHLPASVSDRFILFPDGPPPRTHGSLSYSHCWPSTSRATVNSLSNRLLKSAVALAFTQHWPSAHEVPFCPCPEVLTSR